MTLLLTNMLYDDNRSEDCNDNRENVGVTVRRRSRIITFRFNKTINIFIRGESYKIFCYCETWKSSRLYWKSLLKYNGVVCYAVRSARYIRENRKFKKCPMYMYARCKIHTFVI